MDLGGFYPCLNVRRLDASLAFDHALGYYAVEDHSEQGWAMVRHRNGALCLLQGHIDRSMTSFRGGDVPSIAAHAAAHGLALSRPAHVEADGSWAAEIHDPDGNCLYCNTSPAERERYFKEGRLIGD
jgi:hypothetical protein